MLFAKASESELAVIRQACEADLLTFTAVMFQARMCQPFLVNWHHAKMADELMAVYRGETKNLLITMPPGGTKTELAVIHFMAWCFARSQSCRFLHLSGSKELALLNSETVREIVTLEEFQALWPRQIKNDSRAKNRWNLEFMNRTTGGLYAASSGGQVTGFRAGYIRPGFSGAIIIDDPLKADDIWSKAKRQAVNRKLTGTIRSRRASSEHTPIIMVMQRLHEDDPAAHALSGDFAAEFKHLEIQAIIDEGTENERSYWQEKESLESLNDLKQKDPYTLSAQYQQRPTPAGGAMIKTDLIQRYEVLPDIHTILYVFDTAQKTDEVHDFTVISLWGLYGINVYLIDLLRERYEVPDLEQKAIDFISSHRPRGPKDKRPKIRGAVIEDKSSGIGLIQGLKRKSALRDIPILAKGRDKDKVSRVYNILPFIRAGQLWIPESSATAPWLPAYLGEVAAFSPAMTHKHDDQVDVTVDAIEELLQSGDGISDGMDMS